MQSDFTSPMSNAARNAPGNAAHAADDHHHESIGDDAHIERKLRRLARELQRAPQSREQRAEREHAGEKPLLIDAERGGHVPVFGRRTHQHAPPSAISSKPHSTPSTLARSR